MLKNQIPQLSHLTLTVGTDDTVTGIVFQSRQCCSAAPYSPLISAEVVGQTLRSLLSRYPAGRLSVDPQTETDTTGTQDREQFVKRHEWEALSAALAVYLGVEQEGVDLERCQIDGIQQDGEQLTLSFYLLPPKHIACRQACGRPTDAKPHDA